MRPSRLWLVAGSVLVIAAWVAYLWWQRRELDAITGSVLPLLGG